MKQATEKTAEKTQSRTPLLDRIKDPSMLRSLDIDQLKQVADELRHETIDAVSVTGGHLAWLNSRSRSMPSSIHRMTN
jgi:GGDEF domain-containing protein